MESSELHQIDTRTDLITPGGNRACVCGHILGPGEPFEAHVVKELDDLRESLWKLTEKWLVVGTGNEAADDLYTADTCAEQVRGVLYPTKDGKTT